MNHKTKTKKDNELPWNIPHLRSTYVNSRSPAYNMTLQSFILSTSKVLIFLATLNISKHSIMNKEAIM